MAASVSRHRQEEIADRFIKLLDIRTPDAEKPIGLLSGGNQQKALLARWLATEPRFLILDEPTRGIDVGAHAEIIRLIERLCADGLALLVDFFGAGRNRVLQRPGDRAARQAPRARAAGGEVSADIHHGSDCGP